MNQLFTEEEPSRSRLRHFSWGLALLIGIAASRQEWRPARVTLEFLAGGIFALGTVWPRTLALSYGLFMIATYPIRWLLNHTALALIYYGLLTPLALSFRLFGRQGLRCRIEPDSPSYWQSCARARSPKGYLRQF